MSFSERHESPSLHRSDTEELTTIDIKDPSLDEGNHFDDFEDEELSEYDDTEEVLAGTGHSRFILLGIVLLCSIWSTGLIFGWAPLYELLVRDGVYSELCNSTITPTSNSGSPSTCDAQQSKLNLIYTVGSASAQASLFLSGILLDWQGPKVTSAVSAMLVSMGCAIFGISTTGSVDLFIFGYTLMGFGGAGVNLATYTITNLFPEHKSWVLSALVGVWTLSSLWFLLFRPPFDAGIHLQYAFYFQSALVFATAVFFFMTFPSRSLLEGEYFTFTQWLPWNVFKTKRRQMIKNKTSRFDSPKPSESKSDGESKSLQTLESDTLIPSSFESNSLDFSQLHHKNDPKSSSATPESSPQIASPQPRRVVPFEDLIQSLNQFESFEENGLVCMSETNDSKSDLSSSSYTSASPPMIEIHPISDNNNLPSRDTGSSSKDISKSKSTSSSKLSRDNIVNSPVNIQNKAKVSPYEKQARLKVTTHATLSPMSISTWKIVLKDLITADFILLAIWFSVLAMFMEFYIGTITDALDYRLFGSSTKTPNSHLDLSPSVKQHFSQVVDTYVLVFNFIYAFGFVFVPIYAWITDYLGFTGSFFLATLLNVSYPFLSMIPWMPSQFFTYVIYSAGIQFLYSCEYGYVASRFGYERFGVLIGVVGLLTAALIPMQSFLLSIVLNVFQGDFFWMYMIQGLVCLPLFSIVVVAWWKSRQTILAPPT